MPLGEGDYMHLQWGLLRMQLQHAPVCSGSNTQPENTMHRVSTSEASQSAVRTDPSASAVSNSESHHVMCAGRWLAKCADEQSERERGREREGEVPTYGIQNGLSA
eukprot:453367-Pelagomonas_calceolata.AAC.1